jgi:MFS transporter, PAT family, beta-lactamase induction signal transducer AmpG
MRGSTLTAWTTHVGLDIKTIGLFGGLGLFFTFKPLWAPFIDRYTVPLLGRRRGWMLLAQIGIAVSMAAMGGIDPRKAALALAVMAALTTFLTATHDIATDAYRADMLQPKERAPGSAMYTLGYRGAIIVSGAGALLMADNGVSWPLIYVIMGALMVVGVLATVFGPEPEAVAAPRTMRAAVVEPLKEFWSRPGAMAGLGLLLLYKFGDYMAAEMTTPFLIQKGFTLTQIAGVLKGMGMVATIVGAILGAGVVANLGVRRSLLIFGVLQALMNSGYLAIAILGNKLGLLMVAITADWFCGGLATAAFSAYQLSLCDRRFSATQFALIASASTLLGRSVGMFSGFIVAAWDWKVYFILTMVVAIPGLLLILFGPIERAAVRVEAPKPAAS